VKKLKIGLDHVSVGVRLSIISFVLVAFIFTVYGIVISFSAMNELERQSIGELAAKNQSVIDLIDLFNTGLKREASRSSKILEGYFPGSFMLDVSNNINVSGVSTPILKNGGLVVNLDYSIPDRFSSRSGEMATVFVKSGIDFVRISTSLKNEKGERAVGTSLEHDHPAYKNLINGEPYNGIATLFNRKYFTQYNPIKDGSGQIIGALYVGVDFTEEVKSIKNRIYDLKIGDAGFFFVLDAKVGKSYGDIVVDARRKGQNALAMIDASGREYMKEILAEKNGLIRISAEDDKSGSSYPGERIVIFNHYPDWEWIVVGQAYADDITSEVVVVRNLSLGAGLVAVVILSFLIFVAIRNTVSRPLTQASDIAEQVASGDLTVRMDVHRTDEIGKLARNFNFMIEQVQLRDSALGAELAERKNTEVQLERAAHFDSVTGLPNRHYLNRRLKELSSSFNFSSRSFALLFIDLDNFKYVNDTFGHATGDELLVTVANRLQGSLRSNDVVARLGGDEFAVLLENPKDSDSITQLAGKIVDTIDSPLHCNGREFNVSASIGIAIMPDHARSFDALFSCADAAMYEAKAQGKNTVRIWNPEMSRRTSYRFMIQSGLRKSLENDELELHYQPIVDLANSRITGMEALLRWQHPTEGYISPAKLIPIAEENQLILHIGYWVLRRSCRQIRLWNERFGPMYIAVNVSERQFRDPDFTSNLERIVMEEGVTPSMVELEVTETVLMTQADDMLPVLTGLAERGFRLSLDDFGTGYSSLAYLKQLPLSKLKIDRSFISDLPGDLDDVAIVQAILSLSHHLELEVVGEGIETDSQASFLQQLGCEYGQGYLFSRPLTEHDFEAFAEENIKTCSSRPGQKLLPAL